jgi:hypothetical protein
MATSKLTQPQTGHDIVITTTVELVGVALMAILAGTSDGMGRIMVALMGGFMLVWLMTNTAFLKGIIPHG